MKRCVVAGGQVGGQKPLDHLLFCAVQVTESINVERSKSGRSSVGKDPDVKKVA